MTVDPTDAVVIAGARTPIGRARKGKLAAVQAAELGRVAIEAAIRRSGVDPADIDDLVLAESLQGGGVIGRYVAVELGLAGVPGMAVNRHCAAGLGAVSTAAATIRAGMDRVLVAGGAESLSTMPVVTRDGQWWMSPTHPPTPGAPADDMSITVGENTARIAGIDRRASDEWALMSHQRASAARDDGRFAAEIEPVSLPDGDVVAVDEQPRADTTMERLAELPVLHPELESATVTAGNAAGLNDAGAALVLTSAGYATAAGVAPLARIRSWASVGVPPAETGMAPTLAIPKALSRAGMELEDVDLFEINEAFCSVPIAAVRHLGLDADVVNVVGSGCGLGHPISATGARMVISMINELRRRNQTVGCVSMCAGGGMGSALVLEML